MKDDNQKEINLHCNWETRNHLAKEISSTDSYQIFECKIEGGVKVFYIVSQGIPLGYLRCHDLGDAVMVTAAYISHYRQQEGLGTLLYKAVIHHIGEVISDWDRSEAAEALWAGLEKDTSLFISYDSQDRRYTAKPH